MLIADSRRANKVVCNVCVCVCVYTREKQRPRLVQAGWSALKA